MAEKPEYLFQVRVIRTSEAIASFTVKARNKIGSRFRAKDIAKGCRFKTTAVDYKVVDSQLKVESDVPQPLAEDAYRDYVRTCADDNEFDIATLQTFDDWQDTTALNALTGFAEKYLSEAALIKLDALICDLHARKASRTNNEGLSSQVEALYGALGWEATRSSLCSMLRLGEEWPAAENLGPAGAEFENRSEIEEEFYEN